LACDFSSRVAKQIETEPVLTNRLQIELLQLGRDREQRRPYLSNLRENVLQS
jgi:hypothetical protein